MRIECFTPREWYKIADTISRYCPCEPLVEKLWGQKVGYVLDNNGFLIEICTPIKN